MIKSGLRESSKWQPLFYGKMVWNYAIWDDWFQESWHKAGRLGDLKLKLIFNFRLTWDGLNCIFFMIKLQN